MITTRILNYYQEHSKKHYTILGIDASHFKLFSFLKIQKKCGSPEKTGSKLQLKTDLSGHGTTN